MHTKLGHGCFKRDGTTNNNEPRRERQRSEIQMGFDAVLRALCTEDIIKIEKLL